MQKLITGKSYVKITKPYSFDDLDGRKEQFLVKAVAFTVQEKPATVLFVGERKPLPLPEHFASDKWYFIMDHNTMKKRWLYIGDPEDSEILGPYSDDEE
ncbi:hypothetical protein [Shewanella sp.]|uniref:hypothetical protein n=1 Tax=Shewanella sp. TaxID=50422 RepID=UPI003A98106E